MQNHHKDLESKQILANQGTSAAPYSFFGSVTPWFWSYPCYFSPLDYRRMYMQPYVIKYPSTYPNCDSLQRPAIASNNLVKSMQALPKIGGGYMLTTKLIRLCIPVWPVCTYQSDRFVWLIKIQIWLHHCPSSHRDDQNAYVERPIWTLDEIVMTSERLDPDPTDRYQFIQPSSS